MTQTWTLTDHNRDLNLESFTLDRHSFPGLATECWATKRTLQAGLSKGVEIVEFGNDRFHCTVVPTRGMGIWRAQAGTVPVGWQSPINGPVHPMWVNLADADGIGWLNGFDELLVRCGLESNGAPEFHSDGRLRYPLHGRIANLPAHKVELSLDTFTGELILSGTVDESRLFGRKLRLETTIAIVPGVSGFKLHDRITNLSAEPSEFQLLYHVNFGKPFCAPGSRVNMPIKSLAPRDAISAAEVADWKLYGPESPGSKEVCFFAEPDADNDGWSLALLVGPSRQEAVSLAFNVKQCPCFALWKNRHAHCDGYVTGLEPATNYPNARSFEKSAGRVVDLPHGASRSFDLELTVYDNAETIKGVQDRISSIQDMSIVFDHPVADCSPQS